MATRDWLAIKTEYVTGEIDARALADRVGVAYPTLRDRMRGEGWTVEREAYRRNLVAKTLEYAEQNELTARAMAARATQQAFLDFALLPARERGRRFPELLRLWSAMTGEITERGAIVDEGGERLTDAELESIARGSGAGIISPAQGAPTPD